MKIELKSVHVNARFSRETTCYQAIICVDGVAVAHAENDGGGGCDHYRPMEGKRDLLDAAYAYAKTLPPLKSEYFPEGLPMNLELLVGQLLSDAAVEKRFDALTKKYALESADGKVWQYKAPKGRTVAEVVAALVAKGKIILNVLPRDEALAVFKAAA